MPTPRERPAPCRVLIVDDCPDTRDSCALLLRIWGHDVRTAGDGPSALATAREYHPQAVLLDIGLPGMSGWEVARRLRGLIPTVLIGVTGYGRDEDRERARRDGWDHFLLKPVEPEVLQGLLETVSAPYRLMPRAERRGGTGPKYGLSELARSARSAQLARRAAELLARAKVLRARSESLARRCEATMNLLGRWLLMRSTRGPG